MEHAISGGNGIVMPRAKRWGSLILHKRFLPRYPMMEVRIHAHLIKEITMIKPLTAALALASLVSLPAAAEPKKMSNALLDEVVAGTDYCPPEIPLKGNNGWGNGADPSNPGSPHGGTAASKIANVNLVGANKINTNPTNSTGR